MVDTVTALYPRESELVRVRRTRLHPPTSRRPSLDAVPVALLLAHVPLGIAMKASPSVARAHGLAAIAFVILGALLFTRLSAIIYGAVYIGTADVLWRMTDAGVPWEISKHGLSLICIITLVRFRRVLPDTLALAYFILLLPGAVITLMTLDSGVARNQISFNLSGPFALACSVALFSVVKLRHHEIRRLTYIAVAPIAGMWIIAFQALLETERFTTNSSKAAVGGFGPNQVSTMLGFGALLCLMWAVRDSAKMHRLILFVVGLVLLVQSTLTFSRGGLYNTIVALLCVGVLYLQRPSRVLWGIFGLLVLTFSLSPILERVDEFTDGNLGARFTETDVTGRDEIAGADLEVWRQSPVTGVGVGRSKDLRQVGGGHSGSAAHTEFTRMIAEHGVLGIFAIGVLGLIALRNLSNREELWEQAWSLALMVWTAAAMTNAAMRVGAVSLSFGLASLRLTPTAARTMAARARARRALRATGPALPTSTSDGPR